MANEYLPTAYEPRATNPGANPGLSEYLSKRTDGQSMRKLSLQRQALMMSLEATGLAQPATILNFNPVPLVLDGGLANFKVPSIVDKAVPDGHRLIVKYHGRAFKASVLTVRHPLPYSQIRDVKKVQDVEVGEYDAKACKQIEIAHAFLTAYTFGTESSSGMGGVLIFEGDKNVLGWKSEDRVYTANLDKLTVKVPEFINLPTKEREYFTRPHSFMEKVAEALDLQKTYCQQQTQFAQTFWDNEDLRLNITDVHRLWHQYELDMGWRQKPAPWITLVHETAETCAGCGTPKKNVDAFFCSGPNCGRPYDPLIAYIAGELPVTSHHMTRIPDADWPKVIAEEKRRKERREGLNPPAAEDKQPKGGK